MLQRTGDVRHALFGADPDMSFNYILEGLGSTISFSKRGGIEIEEIWEKIAIARTHDSFGVWAWPLCLLVGIFVDGAPADEAVLKIRALPQLKPSVEADLGGHLFHVQAFFPVFDDFMDDSHTCHGLPLLVQGASDQEMEKSGIVLDQEIRGSKTMMGWNWYFADLGWC